MNRGLLLIIALFGLLVIAAMAALSPLSPKSSGDFFVGGIQVNEPDHRQWVSTVKQAGMNTVSVTVYAKQGDWDSDNLWFEPEEPHVVSEIRTAKAAGMRVVLILRVALDHAYKRNQFLWHGMIAPTDQATLDSWFEKYERFVLKWAAISEAEQIDVLAIGSEMNALSATVQVSELPGLEEWYLNAAKQTIYRNRILKFSDRVETEDLWVRGTANFNDLDSYLNAKSGAYGEWAKKTACVSDKKPIKRINERRALQLTHWRNLIAETRLTYSGKLSYAANFDNFEEVGFWKELDIIGINAYFALREPGDETVYNREPLEYLTDRWEIVLDNIEVFREMNGLMERPVLFTELGYTFRKYATLEPWGGFGFSVVGDEGKEKLMVWQQQPIDFHERTLAVKALHRAHEARSAPLLNGILYWKLTTNKQHLDIEPFALHIGPSSTDSLQVELARFLTAD